MSSDGAESIARQIADDVARLARSRHEAIERACEISLVGGVCGVSVYDNAVVIDPDVPYGQIRYHARRTYEGSLGAE